MSEKSSLDRLLNEASQKFDVEVSILKKILNIERSRIYLQESSRNSVIIEVRRLIQGEVKK